LVLTTCHGTTVRAVSRDEDKKDRDDDTEADEAAEGEASESETAAPADDADRDASTRGIAEAMGIDAEEGEVPTEEGEKADEESAAPNRQQRRRDQATARRKKRAKKAEAAGEGEAEVVVATDPDLPRDKNARAKELLKRRQQSAAAAKRGGGPSGLDTGEMVQDALARGSSAATGFVRRNARVLFGALIVAALGAGGFIFFRDRMAEQKGAATGALADALASDRGRVIKEDKRSEEEKQADPTRVYPTSDARAQAALEGYEKAVAATSEPGPNTLAKLGLAGAKLEKGDLQGAIDGYAQVLATPLAAADLDVKGRAVEGTGLALEQKGDKDAALKSYEELARIDAKGFEELGLYHQARVYAQKGDKEKAKELLKKAREKLQLPGEAGQAFPFLEAVVDGDLRSLDPTALPAARVQMGGAKGNTMSPEDMERIQEQLKKLMEKKQGPGDHPEGDDHGDEPKPPPFGMKPQKEPQ
jgi:tetratricopeptide (TPR) repeat protein